MAKKKNDAEELDEELEESEEGSESGEEKSHGEKIKLDFDMDPIERLKIEIDATNDGFVSVIGNFLLEEFKKDEVLADCYRSRKCTLKAIGDFLYDQARKYAGHAQKVAIDNETVYGWAIHFVQDGKIKETKSSSYTLTKEEKKSIEEQAKEEYLAKQRKKIEEQEKKDAEKKKRALQKEEEKRKASGQISLFDFTDDDEGGDNDA